MKNHSVRFLNIIYVCLLLSPFLLAIPTQGFASPYPGFDFTLSETSYWEFYWTYESVSYAQGGSPVTTTDTGNFRLGLGTPVTIDGITAFPINVNGKTSDPGFDYSPRWNYLALHDNRLLGSINGTDFTVIFDANTGTWTGGGLFAHFPEDSPISVTSDSINNEFIQTAALVSSRSQTQSRCEWYGTIQVCPGDESYTIHEREYYKGGIGPIGYYYFLSYSNDSGGFYTSSQKTRHLGLVATSHTSIDGFVPSLPPWSEVAPLPEPRSGHSSTAIKGKIYVFGGNSSNSLLIYDPVANRWSRGDNMPESSSGHASHYYNGKVYLFGGSLKNVLVYDPDNGSWETKAASPSQIEGEFITSADIGPYFLTFTSNDLTVPTYSVTDDQWLWVTSMPTAHYWPGACSTDNRIYVLGGYEVGYNYSAILQDTCLEFNPYVAYGSEEAWNFCSDIPTARANLSCAYFEGKIFAIGGRGNSKTFRSVEAYDPGSNSWSVEKSLNNERENHSTAVVNGRLYVIGGESSSQKLSSVEMFTPADSDSDGLSDYVEQKSTCLDYLDNDTDNDGLIDGLEDINRDGLWTSNTETNPCSADSDGDGIADGVEDDNHNGVVDLGETDPRKPDYDSDQDGVVDTLDICPGYNDTFDADSDGIVDCLDNGDSDNDGFSDRREVVCGSDPANPTKRCAIITPWLILLLD